MSGKKVKVGNGGRTMTTRSMAKEGKEHPLMNHLVLESVFKYLSVKDLKVVRQVSPLWRDCARKKWNKCVQLRISQLQLGFDLEEKDKLFLEMVASDEKKAFTLGVGLQTNWATLCAQIKSLELARVTLPTLESLRNALFRCFPNLENLSLGSIDVLDAGHLSSEPTSRQLLKPQIEEQHWNLKSFTVILWAGSPHLPISWMELLAHFPSLEKIDVSAPRMATQTVFRTINQIREVDPSKLNLKDISIWITDYEGGFDVMIPEVLTTFTDRRLKLEALQYEELIGERDITSLRNILQTHSGTLKTLRFDLGPEVPFSEDCGFPQLSKLQKLSLTMSSSPVSMQFLQFTPNLTKLRVYTYPDSDQPQIYANFVNFPIMLGACKELDFSDPGMSFTTENLKSLMKWTPNLETLKIVYLDNEKFAMICENWTKLVELNVEESEVDASGLTGWDEKDVKRLDSLRRSKKAAALPVWRPTTVPRANITGLKNLQIFIMSASEPEMKLGWAAGVHGIEMLPDLRLLCIVNYKILPKDRNYWKSLHERYPIPE